MKQLSLKRMSTFLHWYYYTMLLILRICIKIVLKLNQLGGLEMKVMILSDSHSYFKNRFTDIIKKQSC